MVAVCRGTSCLPLLCVTTTCLSALICGQCFSPAEKLAAARWVVGGWFYLKEEPVYIWLRGPWLWAHPLGGGGASVAPAGLPLERSMEGSALGTASHQE